MTPQYRIAGPDDVAAVRALVESAYRGDSARRGWSHEADLLSDERTSEAEIAEVIADPAQRMILAEVAGRLLGTVTVARKSARRAYLGMLAVDPGAQAGGLGRGLLAAAEAEAVRSFAAVAIEMTVISRRAELIAWYERRGYHRTGELRPFPVDVPEAPGLEMVVLERALA